MQCFDSAEINSYWLEGVAKPTECMCPYMEIKTYELFFHGLHNSPRLKGSYIYSYLGVESHSKMNKVIVHICSENTEATLMPVN